ncbi:MAG: aspartate carbamoyltransferase [Bacteroidetes bacterium]|nr:MAG: aspartate carbamoyltransferase [Bacteroidota bacterium]
MPDEHDHRAHHDADTSRTHRQAEVAARGAEVMPFDLDRTIHVFEETEDGGVQRVLVRDEEDREQVVLIRQHLREQAARFARGDFSAPAQIHGEAMPGLRELASGAARLEVRYEDIPGGALIRYVSSDTALVRALHRWFAAQRRDHGRHARGH